MTKERLSVKKNSDTISATKKNLPYSIGLSTK